VDDTITKLPERDYLDLDGKPYQFEKVYIEVSCGKLEYFYPEFFTFIKKHLKPGGKLIMEMPDMLLNFSLGFEKSLMGECSSSEAYTWPWGDEKTHLEKDNLESIAYQYDDEDQSTLISVKFQGDMKTYFENLGFTDVQLSKEPIVQIGTRPVEMTLK
jgi:hypothetical protein